MSTQNDTIFWNAVVGRDGAFDGLLFYGVLSTGIYCRPTCPSKRPNRENVTYFTVADEAERQGFRACKRCKPKVHKPIGDDASLVERAIRHMEGAKGAIEGLADALGVSDRHLRNVFSRVLGASPGAVARSIRFNTLKKGLGQGESVANAMYDAGFGSPSRLYESANLKMGMSPATYAKGGREAVIRYAIGACDLGYVMIAATPHGVAALRLADNEQELEQELKGEFYAARLLKDDGALQPWLGAIVNYCNGKGDLPRLPLDVIATAFQAKVWQALMAIPMGVTSSYGDIAKAIGQPKSARAIGRACGSNGVALIVPCHRVVREGGAINGYRWGVERKKHILDMEKKK